MNFLHYPTLIHSSSSSVSALIAMAFFTLLERKMLGYFQHRKGPNKASLLGVPQPLMDALKLISKEQVSPTYANINAFSMFPGMALTLALLLWALYPIPFSSLHIKFSLILFLCISAMNVYAIMGAGWSSNSKYALLGSLRSVAQTISYEVTMTVTALTSMLVFKSFSISWFFTMGPFTSLILPLVCMIWLLSCLAETSRAPFDHAEGESELVSGFNTEYSGAQFALIFMAEYMNILFLSALSSVIMLNTSLFIASLATTLLLAAWFIWVRATLPRVRYDKLMSLAWKTYLPAVLSFLLLTTPLTI